MKASRTDWLSGYLLLRVTLWTSTAHKEADQEQNNTDYEDNFRCASRCTGQTTKA
ncbi:hypothetical protein FHW74_001269 [Atlantibacter sp. RC6]|nr:hypothetical protein [Atlantibacter sp. RC6]